MNADSEQNDESLRQHLQEWRINRPVPPRFQEQVRQRIERQDRAAAAGFRFRLQTLLARLFTRPAWVAGYVAAALVAGLSLGFWQAQEKAGTLTARLEHQYIQSV